MKWLKSSLSSLIKGPHQVTQVGQFLLPFKVCRDSPFQLGSAAKTESPERLHFVSKLRSLRIRAISKRYHTTGMILRLGIPPTPTEDTNRPDEPNGGKQQIASRWSDY